MYERYRCLKNMINQTGSQNEWLLLPASSTSKFGLAFALAPVNAFS